VKRAVTFGTTLPLKAKLTRADTNAALANQPIEVFRRSPVSTHWRLIRTLTTNQSGRATTVLHPSRSARLRMVFPGAKGVARASSHAKYLVRPAVVAALSQSTVAAGSRVTLSGSATPFTAGQEVSREALVNGSWQTQATATVDRHGQFSFTIRPKVVGEEILRAVVAASTLRTSGHSHRVHLTVTAPAA
jgi:hypothetical protein